MLAHGGSRPKFVLFLLILLFPFQAPAEIRYWRVGDQDHPWNLVPVTGRLTWGRGWAVEILTDDDGDGLIDEDPIELVDSDGDGLFNEDPPDPQIDSDGDGRLNEDPPNKLDDDGDGLIDEDPVEAFDSDLDGRIDEDGPDPQFDSDGDGRLNEDGLMTDGDDDLDGRTNEDPYNGTDDDGDGLIDEDGPRLRDTDGVETWLRPILLNERRNLAILLNERYLQGEFGGVGPDGRLLNPFLEIPSEFGPRVERADPISGDYFKSGSGGGINRVDYGKMVDGDLFTAFGTTSTDYRVAGIYGIHGGGASLNLMGFYHINRLIFQPRPTLPVTTIANYFVVYGDPTTVNHTLATLEVKKILVPVTREHTDPVKDLRFDPPVLIGRLDVASLDSDFDYKETAEVGLFGEGFASDASFTSEVIDVGTPTPRARRYSQLLELFDDAGVVEAEFPDRLGSTVNWGKVRWRGRKTGSAGDMRIQFRAGDAPNTHIYARDSGANEIDTRGEDGRPLDAFSWLKLRQGRIPEAELRYNELGPDLGSDGPRGWSFWSAPFSFEDGLIDERLPEERWSEAGVPLPLPTGTRYLQFRILFDSTIESAVALDYLEFDYDEPLVSGGVVAEVFPPRVALGETVSLRYFLRPFFADGEEGGFNRIELTVPDASTRIDTFKFDGRAWEEIAVPTGVNTEDPLLQVEPLRLEPEPDSLFVIGQFAQTTVSDPQTGETRLLVKFPLLGASDFKARQSIEIGLRTRLFRGSARFAGSVWNDRLATREATIPQLVRDGDAVQRVATDATLVVVDDIQAHRLQIQAAPNPFTPNGDGINDAIEFAFDLFLVLDQVEVAVEILDLSGRRMHRLGPVSRTAGQTKLKWNGRDAAGHLLAPGLYLYRLQVAVDQTSTEALGVLSLVY